MVSSYILFYFFFSFFLFFSFFFFFFFLEISVKILCRILRSSLESVVLQYHEVLQAELRSCHGVENPVQRRLPNRDPSKCFHAGLDFPCPVQVASSIPPSNSFDSYIELVFLFCRDVLWRLPHWEDSLMMMMIPFPSVCHVPLLRPIRESVYPRS